MTLDLLLFYMTPILMIGISEFVTYSDTLEVVNSNLVLHHHERTLTDCFLTYEFVHQVAED